MARETIYTVGRWLIMARKEQAFIAAWKGLGTYFLSLAEPPGPGTLLDVKHAAIAGAHDGLADGAASDYADRLLGHGYGAAFKSSVSPGSLLRAAKKSRQSGLP